jgi:membrane-bound lytic murein transglycosylase F
VVLSDTFPLCWAVSKGNVSLLRELNNWLDSLKKRKIYPILLNKYYSPNSQNRQKITQQQRKTNASISVYDPLIKKQAERYGLDWRLVAAIINQESRFKPDLLGKGGSFGLMQLMPATAKQINISDSYSIEGQIASGCKLLYFLTNWYAKKGISDTLDLYKYAVASYNAGHGRIDNGMELTEAVGLNPLKWQDVESILPKMSDRKFIRDAGLNMHSYNGTYTQNYVSRVWTVYQHYCNIVE